MIEKIGPVKNPLTVIAIFAGVAEISGTGVLPLLSPGVQEIYVWFLMAFPVILVTLFFITLNYNHRVLYAPSDFRDDGNFLKLMRSPSPEEKVRKLAEDLAEVSHEMYGETTGDRGHKTEGKLFSRRGHAPQRKLAGASYLVAAQLVVAKLANEFGGREADSTQVIIDERRYEFDGAILKEGEVFAVEVKYFRGEVARDRLDQTLTKAQELVRELTPDYKRSFNLILAILTDGDPGQMERRVHQAIGASDKYNFEIIVRVFAMSELEKELSSIDGAFITR